MKIERKTKLRSILQGAAGQNKRKRHRQGEGEMREGEVVQAARRVSCKCNNYCGSRSGKAEVPPEKGKAKGHARQTEKRRQRRHNKAANRAKIAQNWQRR